jgi:SAM-dependent MidA family methyltransferase
MGRREEIESLIRETISREGPIPFEKFMDMALYYPDLGYYSSVEIEIGRKGDFYTSPHLHPLFGAVIGRQIEECWNLIERPDICTIVEQGAGQGYLALDILDYLKNREIYDSIAYVIIEMNPAVALSQQELLSGHQGRVRWARVLKELEPFRGIFLSNELLDAFPVHLIRMDDEVKEIYVGVENGRFVEIVKNPSTPAIREYVTDFSLYLPKGYRTEISLGIREWLGDISSRMTEGFVITIDYGYEAKIYYDSERDKGTLMCYYRHQANEDPFQNIGMQDITAHVNFSTVKKWGEEFGFKTAGFCSQGTYLVSMGLDEVITERFNLGSGEPDENYQFEMAKVKGLILPAGMGESHKVMVQYKGRRDITLRGFSCRNRVNIL